MSKVNNGLKRRTNNRLARIRLSNPNALHGIRKGGYTTREAARIKSVDARQRAKAKSRRAPAPEAYNPLAPLTGARAKQEEAAAAQLEFGPRQRELQAAQASQQQTERDTGNYYDDYKRALDASTQRVAANDAANVKATQGQVDKSFRQDSAAVNARDAAASADAAKLGRGPAVSVEGHQATEAARSQGNQAAASSRDLGSADNAYMEARAANSVLAKAQALAREKGKAAALRKEGANLASDRGAFAVANRAKTRDSERQYAAVQKEFGLKKKDLGLKYKTSAADRGLERQKVEAQKIIARMYSGGHKASARAQIRVAQLQLKKGKIDANQFKTIKNIYEGLPSGGGKTKKVGNGSGPGGKLANWEKDKVSNATTILDNHHAKPSDKAVWLKRMQAEGVPARLAAIAWRRYLKTGPQYSPAPGN